VLHEGVTHDPIQGQSQGHGGLKMKMADFKVYILRQYACNKNNNGEF